MNATNSIDLDQTRFIWRGKFPPTEERKRVIETYGADKGLAQTTARLADGVAAQAGSGNT